MYDVYINLIKLNSQYQINDFLYNLYSLLRITLGITGAEWATSDLFIVQYVFDKF